jgi:integration host factor subunit alpha
MQGLNEVSPCSATFAKRQALPAQRMEQQDLTRGGLASPVKLLQNGQPLAPLATEGSMTITKADLATLLHDNLGVNKREAAEIVMDFFEAISTELEKGEPVKLSGFGVFCLRNKNSRPGRNPKTGEIIPVSARRVVMFHPSHILKREVHEHQPTARIPSGFDSITQAEEREAEEISVPV